MHNIYVRGSAKRYFPPKNVINDEEILRKYVVS